MFTNVSNLQSLHAERVNKSHLLLSFRHWLQCFNTKQHVNVYIATTILFILTKIILNFPTGLCNFGHFIGSRRT